MGKSSTPWPNDFHEAPAKIKQIRFSNDGLIAAEGEQ